MGALRPPNPQPRSAVERIFGACHSELRLFFQQPMSAWGEFLMGASPHTPTTRRIIFGEEPIHHFR